MTKLVSRGDTEPLKEVGEEPVPKVPEWRSHLPTERQLAYIANLYHRRNLKPPVVLTKGEASDIIGKALEGDFSASSVEFSELKALRRRIKRRKAKQGETWWAVEEADGTTVQVHGAAEADEDREEEMHRLQPAERPDYAKVQQMLIRALKE